MIARYLHRHAVRYVALLALAASAMLLGGATHQAHAAGSTALLPDLVADPPDGIELATDSSTGTNRLLLRFNGYIHNKGPGAVDFRGTRVAPKLSAANEKRVKEAEEKKEGLPQGIEEELAASPMKAFQRLFTTKEGQEETNIERAHVDESSPAELIFASADGHHHWHLQHAAKYSLWNATKSAEVAPAQKVGFCLDDSQHVELGKGPATAVYADNVAPFRDFCQQYRPNATSLFEGISPGWRDLYSRELAFQWVDASNVLPGEYWLREEVNPLGVVKEAGGANVPVYAPSATTIPGFDALAQAVATHAGEAKAITLTAKAWSDSATPKYAIVAQPQHGSLSAIGQGKVTYTPSAGYTGADSFTFSAADPNSQFPTSPAVATASIEVGEAQAGTPTVAIEGAPESIVAGASVQLKANVTNDSSTVTWTASAGTITQAGLYTAPSEAATVTVTATTSKGAKDQKTIKVTASGTKTLLAGDATSTYSVEDKTSAGREEAFQFTAKASGTIEELRFRTNTVSNAGLTGLALGVFAESAGKPGEVLGKATVSGEPATSSWITATGLSTAVTSGTKYWLVALPVGPSGKALHFNAAAKSGGTGNVESTVSGLSTLTAESSWESYAQGPVGFQALGGGSVEATPTVAIEGAPESIVAGASVQLKANVTNDSSTVTWAASAGTITQAGLYTAPSEPPAGGSVTVTATTSKGAKDQKTIKVTAPATPTVAIEGAPESIVAGASVQLKANVTNDSSTVTWTASAGTITQAGLYTAPSEAATVTVTATTSKGAKDQKTIKVTASGTKTLLAGDATSTYSVEDKTSAGREEAFQFTAKASGTIEELRFRTNTVSNAGLTGLALGVFAENAGKPGEVLGKATVNGEPATSSWITATGLSTAVTSGTKYWLVALPVGPSGKALHFNAAAKSGGTGNVESTVSGLSTLTAESSWESYAQGPVGFQALGGGSVGQAKVLSGGSAAKLASSPPTTGSPPSSAPSPSVAIAGAQSKMLAGTAVQLSAVVANDEPGVSWRASAGTIGASGWYTAPAKPPAGGTVTLSATTAHGARDELEVAIEALTAPLAAPLAPLPEAAPTPGAGRGSLSHAKLPALSAPAAMRVGQYLVMTARPGKAGRLAIGAYLGKRRLGGCVLQTPAGRTMTCRVKLSRIAAGAAIGVRARLSTGAGVTHTRRPDAAVPEMKMPGMTMSRTAGRYARIAASYLCGPIAHSVSAVASSD